MSRSRYRSITIVTSTASTAVSSTSAICVLLPADHAPTSDYALWLTAGQGENEGLGMVLIAPARASCRIGSGTRSVQLGLVRRRVHKAVAQSQALLEDDL